MKKAAIIIFLIAIIPLNAFSSIFSGYDFSFFSSVAESIAIADSEKIGLDYSGYGYLGDMTSGVFLRLGFQAPYSTLLHTLDDLMNPDRNNETSITNPEQGAIENTELESRIKNYTFLVAIGPAFRRIVSPTLSWYMGLGLKLQIDWETISSSHTSTDTTLTYMAATDIDIGFRITADIHTTIRIGAYISRPLFMLNQIYNTQNGESSENAFEFFQNIYPDLNQSDNTTSTVGYIAVGHTYASYLRDKPMRYIITSRNIGEGILEEM